MIVKRIQPGAGAGKLADRYLVDNSHTLVADTTTRFSRALSSSSGSSSKKEPGKW